jgi:hypothetical protein
VVVSMALMVVTVMVIGVAVTVVIMIGKAARTRVEKK